MGAEGPRHGSGTESSGGEISSQVWIGSSLRQQGWRRLESYWQLTKPGIAFNVSLTALAGFLIAGSTRLEWTQEKSWLLLHLVIGILFVSGGAGALNMLMEHRLDALMLRTRHRPLPSGKVFPAESLFLGLVGVLFGVAYLAHYVNGVCAAMAFFSALLYLVVYTPMKKFSSACMFWGAISGALPVLVGWSAQDGTVELLGVALFAILFVWQYPHLLALSYMYREDYQRAGFLIPYLDDADSFRVARAAFISSGALMVVGITPVFFSNFHPFYVPISFLLGNIVLFFAGLWLKKGEKKNATMLFLSTLFYLPMELLLLVLFLR